MKLDNDLELRPAVVPDENPKDVYDSVALMQADYPDARPLFGARVVAITTGFTARGYESFYKTLEAAFSAWQSHALA